MVRIQPFSVMRNATSTPKYSLNQVRLNSKRVRQLRLLLEAGKVEFIKSSSPLSKRSSLQSLQKFSRTITLNHFRKIQTSAQVQIVGKSNKFKGAELVSPLFSADGTPLSKARLRKLSFYRTRFYEALSSNPNRIKHAYRILNRPNSPFPPFLKSVLNRIGSLSVARLPSLKYLTRRKVAPRLNELGISHDSFLNTNLSSQNSKSFNFSKDHVQKYILSTYSNLPKTLSYALKRPSALLYGSFANLSQRILNQQSPVFSNWIFLWSKLVFLYVSFSLLPRIELYLRCKKAQKRVVRHHLRFRFNRQRLILTLADEPTRSTHMFISPGLFLKYFQRKKSLKKNKSMKFLMVRFMRKVLLVLRVKNVVINSRGVPLHLNSLLSVLFRPFSHHFEDPLTSTLINETEDQRSNINVSSIMFTSPRPFGFQKTRKMGRVKRKIRRRITRLGNVID